MVSPQFDVGSAENIAIDVTRIGGAALERTRNLSVHDWIWWRSSASF